MPNWAAGKFVLTSDAVRLSNLSRVFAVDEVRNFCSRRRHASGNTLKKGMADRRTGASDREPPAFGDASQKADSGCYAADPSVGL